ncbi:MAG: hypothetical protein CSA76_03610 [Spirochaetales bacterium]|nr:MAG: hypothetical protein CSA76_03610 [Spirochaetales bacterium]
MSASFVFYESFHEAISMIGDPAERAKAYGMICEYALTGEEPESEPGMAYMVFVMAKPQIDTNNKRRKNGQKGAEHGSKGGRPEKKEENPIGVADKNPIGVNQENPIGDIKKTPNVNVNVNDNDISPPLSPPRGAGLDFSFIAEPDWRDLFAEWAKDKRNPYKKITGAKKGYAHLRNLSGGSLQAARRIVDRSLANNWAGLFPLDRSPPDQLKTRNILDIPEVV